MHLHDVDWENFTFNMSKLFRSLSANFRITAVFLKPIQPSATVVTGRKSFDKKDQKLNVITYLYLAFRSSEIFFLRYWVMDTRIFGTSWLSHIRGLYVQQKANKNSQ
jgi:hypothetical protein